MNQRGSCAGLLLLIQSLTYMRGAHAIKSYGRLSGGYVGQWMRCVCIGSDAIVYRGSRWVRFETSERNAIGKRPNLAVYTQLSACFYAHSVHLTSDLVLLWRHNQLSCKILFQRNRALLSSCSLVTSEKLLLMSFVLGSSPSVFASDYIKGSFTK